jgi:hypothetical protein
MTRHRFAPQRRRPAASASGARAVPRGTRFRFRLSERARVTITIARVLPGRTVRIRGKSRCAKPVRRNRRARPCLRIRKVGTLRTAGHAGRDGMRFSGRMRGRPLPRGRYRATIVARDALDSRSQPRSVGFRIVRPDYLTVHTHQRAR